MVSILYDPEHLVPPAGEQTVANVSEYAGAYARLLAALQNNQDFRLVVCHQAVYQWLKNLAARYPQGAFVFETLDARQALAQKWGVPIPDETMNEEVQATGLLQLDLHAQPGQDFTDLLLMHFYSPLFSAKAFPFTQLPQFFQSLDNIKWQNNRTNPLLARSLHTRISEWQTKARSSEQRQLMELFAENPFDLQDKVMAFRVLQKYPSLGETLLGALYPIFSALKLPLQDLVVDENRIPAVVTQITYQLNAYQPGSVEELSALLDQVSGFLWVECETILKHLLAHPEWISYPLVDQLEGKFVFFSRRLMKTLANLRSHVRPAKPQAPDAGWDAEEMLAWASQSYLPYQTWCSTQGQFDKSLYVLGDRFSEWLLERWDDIHANSGRMVFNILPNIAGELKQPGRVHLILVIDNLGWSFSETLRDLFQEHGFYLISSEPYIAMLPSETEISKKCLLSGAVGYTDIDEKTYKGMLEKGMVPYFGDSAFRYVSDIGSLGALEVLDASVYVVNYLAVDRVLHKSAGEIGMPHREHIRHLLEKLVENVVTFVDKHTLADSIRVHVVSDHGSTQIPVGLQNDLDLQFYKQTGFTARSHRYLEVSDERFSELAENLKMDCFFLPAPEYRLPANFLCARRANRFLPTDSDSFVHGGVLPEEVIVPYLAFEPTTIPLKDLDLTLRSNTFRYRREDIDLEIGNPNDASVEQVQVSALNSNVEWEFSPIPQIHGKRKASCQIPARFKITSLPEEQTTLHLRVRYRCRGDMHAFDVKLPIVMRKMVEEKSASVFDD